MKRGNTQIYGLEGADNEDSDSAPAPRKSARFAMGLAVAVGGGVAAGLLFW